MITIRRANERGHANHGWLDTYHTFSFADYYDPDFMGFRALRVINEDVVAPANGFGTHQHRDMEIITYVLAGGLQHRDSMGNGSIIHPGDVQRMSAGTGVLHSEKNPSSTEPVHLLQIWILPAREGTRPSYEEKRFDTAERRGRLRLVASPDAAEGSVTVHQDVRLYAALLDDESATHSVAPGRHAWVQVVRGELDLNGQTLRAGDGAAVSEETTLTLAGRGAELLLFDLA